MTALHILPNELILHISSFLSPRHLSSLTRTARCIHQLLIPILHKHAAEPYNHSSAIEWAIRRGHTPHLRLLLSLGHRPSFRGLHDAVLGDKFEMVMMILDAGIDVNLVDYLGKNALCSALSAAMASLLLSRGADSHQADWKGFTPLHHAAGQRARDVVKVLLERDRVEVDVRSTNGETPLMVALSSYPPHVGIVLALIAEGADVNATNNDGFTPSDFAVGVLARSVMTMRGGRRGAG